MAIDNRFLKLEILQKKLSDFAKEREWEQFHNPKNLSMALSVEASELLEIFQWMPDKDSSTLGSKELGRVREEIADIMLYAIRISDLLDINLPEALSDKIAQNGEKYPIEKSIGSSKKYTEFT